MERTSCLICGGSTSGKPAAIAPFLVTYLGFDKASTEVRYCKSCDFVFFQRRLTDNEAKRLYTDYRGDEYNRVRIAVEPSYAPMVKYFSDPLCLYYVERLRDYLDVVDVFPELNQAKTVLDFGGDGSVPSRLFTDAKIAIDDLSAGSSGSAPSRFDLVFASNVFEHVSDPVLLLKQVARKLAPEGILVIDVPKPTQASLGEGLLWQERYGGELFEMHEHINHFSKRSLGLLVAAAGLESFFEYSARHGAQTALAALPGSDIVRRLSVERPARTLLFETRMARAETQAANNYGRDISKMVSEHPVGGLKEEMQRLREQVEALRGSFSPGGEGRVQGNSQQDGTFHNQQTEGIRQELQAMRQEIEDLRGSASAERNKEVQDLREQVKSMYASTSWRLTAPIRSAKEIFRKTMHLLGVR